MHANALSVCPCMHSLFWLFIRMNLKTFKCFCPYVFVFCLRAFSFTCLSDYACPGLRMYVRPSVLSVVLCINVCLILACVLECLCACLKLFFWLSFYSIVARKFVRIYKLTCMFLSLCMFVHVRPSVRNFWC